jgi:alcohol dehydrogenase
MKGIYIKSYGDISNLLYSESIEIPKIKTDKDILIQIYSASLNPVDYKLRNGESSLVLTFPLPFVVGFDFSGVVVDIGKKVTKFKKGDEVYSCKIFLLFFELAGQIGSCAEYIVVPETILGFKPKNLTHDETASIPMVAMTSMQAFEDFKNTKNKDVLITGG